MVEDRNLLDSAIVQCREALLLHGTSAGAFDRRICRCADPNCLYLTPATFPLHLLLQEVARVLDGALPQPSADAVLRGPLTLLGDAFDLFSCSCRDPECPALTAREGTINHLASTVFLKWYSMSGVVARDTTDDELNAAEMGVRNLHTVEAWYHRIEQVGSSHVRELVARFAGDHRSSPWRREAILLASECVDRWIPNPGSQQEVQAALENALLVAEIGGFDRKEAADWMLLWNDLLLALLTRDLADPAVTDALYSPMEPLIPLAVLRLAVFAGETGAPLGFFEI
jgi:hypothetical protein